MKIVLTSMTPLAKGSQGPLGGQGPCFEKTVHDITLR